MIRVRTDTRMHAVVLLTLACALLSTVFAAIAGAGPPDPSSTTTESTTTTESSTTTTTSRPSSTTTQARPSTTGSTVPRSTTSSLATTTTSEPPTTTTEAPQPEIVTDGTLPSRGTASDDGGLSTDTKLALVVGGLVALGALIGVLTFFYWRHTRPQRYMTALDALADVEQKVPRGGDDVPTAEHAVIGAGAAAGAAGATTAVRIIEPDDAQPGNAKPDDVTSDSGETAMLDEATTITTIEDLKSAGQPDEAPPAGE